MKNLIAAIVDGDHDGEIERHYTPYRYAIIRHALPMDLYNRLIVERPHWTDIAGEDAPPNVRKDISYKQALVDRRGPVSALWLEFMEAHGRPEFYREVCRLLSLRDRTIDRDYQIMPRKVRSRNKLPRINMDCQIGVNTPNTRRAPERVRGPHVDFEGELWAGMLYMPHWFDTAGGDLVLYEATKPVEDIIHTGKAEVADEDVREVARVPYWSNTAVFFENGLACIHGVSPRKPGPFPRQFVNFLAEVSEAQFHLRRE